MTYILVSPERLAPRSRGCVQCGRNLACREALRAYSSTIDEDLRLLGDEAEVAADSAEHKAIVVRNVDPYPNNLSPSWSGCCWPTLAHAEPVHSEPMLYTGNAKLTFRYLSVCVRIRYHVCAMSKPLSLDMMAKLDTRLTCVACHL